MMNTVDSGSMYVLIFMIKGPLCTHTHEYEHLYVLILMIDVVHEYSK